VSDRLDSEGALLLPSMRSLDAIDLAMRVVLDGGVTGLLTPTESAAVGCPCCPPRGDVARHQPDSFASRLPVRCLISGRLLHGELGRRVCLQAFVRVGAPLRIEQS